MCRLISILLLLGNLFGDTITYYKKGFDKRIILENVEYINVENIRKTKYLKFKNLKKKKIYVKCEKIISWIDENGNKKEFDCDKLKSIPPNKEKSDLSFSILFFSDSNALPNGNFSTHLCLDIKKCE